MGEPHRSGLFLRPLLALLLALLWATAPSNAPAVEGGPVNNGAVNSGALGGGAVILMYHRIGEDRYPSTSVRLSQFEAHLKELKRGGYKVRPVPDIVEDLRAGRVLAPGTVGITFDDAYATVYSKAWPRLRQAGFPFTLFVATEPIDRRYKGMISWDGLRRMVKLGGVTLGNHSVRHGHMAVMSPAAVREEFLQASQRMAQELGERPTLLAYPYGEYGLATRNAVVGLGFRGAFGQHSGAIGHLDDAFTLPRFPVNERYGSIKRLREILRALPLPVTRPEPVETLLTPGTNPPPFAITIDASAGPLTNLRCYLSGRGVLELKRTPARRIEAIIPAPFAPGRSRVNCTLPAPGNRYRWYGRQFYLPPP